MQGVAIKKGPRFEKDVVEYLRKHGFPHAERRVMGGANDRGDVAGVPGVCMEIKNTVSINMGLAMKEATIEARNANVPFKAVVFKRIQKPVEQAYVLLELSDLVTLIASARLTGDQP